jgi:single-strand DNA-binding protein
MANDLNKVILIGRLTRDPEFKTVGSTSLANFSIACGRTWYDANKNKKEETHFFDCEVWGKLAEVLRDYAKKGQQLATEGRLVQQTWDTPDGKKASKVRVRVETFQLLGRPSGAGGGSSSGYSSGGAESASSYIEPPPTDFSAGDLSEEDVF